MRQQEKYDWMVYVSCMTFNHAPYIVDAMNGFTMQETNFPFVCAIVDDVSTDGEQEIIKQYLNEHFDLEDKNVVRQEETDDYVLTFARHKTNLNCYFAVLFLRYNHYSIKKPKVPYLAQWRDNAKYMAICEGDDYWTHPQKLQEQYNFMERNEIFSACATNSIVVGPKKQKLRNFSEKHSRSITGLGELVRKRQFHTASVFYRKKCVEDLYNTKESSWDTLLWCWLATKGPIWYDDRITCTYRKAGQGVTDTTPSIKWIELNERWSNMLYDAFFPKYLTHTDAYLSLIRDILNQLINNKDLSKEEREKLKKMYKHYISMSIRIKNIGYVYSLYRNRCVVSFRKWYGKRES